MFYFQNLQDIFKRTSMLKISKIDLFTFPAIICNDVTYRYFIG